MKVSKTQAVLYIFKLLLNKQRIKKEEIQNYINVSDLAFRRYIQELRAFLVNFDEGYEIVYSKNDNSYLLCDLKR